MKAVLRHILPYPVLSLALLLLWLLLQQSLALGHWLLGALIALGAGRAMLALQPERVRLGSFWAMIQLAGFASVDVLRSNIAVATIALSGRARRPRPAFVTIELELRDRVGLAVLSVILTAAPGSAWLDYDPVHNSVRLHVLDLVDETVWVQTVKQRYERLLLEIFPVADDDE